ncbi:MAG TPA: xanthine dehydrogenase family protein molybdopterin-binding subunit [Vicinamibacterales bacterium]|jgi:CO/xanthine dehydrogenase Mo-binding subunit|nr:xanthine dehydrogenase family protein molybdopterin-binding subunit [Vicinamibacterales bacterium]
MDAPQIGRSVLRKEGRAKVTGQALYVDDVTPAGTLHGVTVRSPIARGRIIAIRFDPSIPWGEYTVVTAKDIPGVNIVKLIADDQPYLASEAVNHPEEPVVLIAHRDRARAAEARRHVTIEIDPLPPVFTIEESLARREIIWGADNVFKHYSVAKGDVDAAFANAAAVVEGTYETGAQEQLYIEPNGMLAVADPRRGVTVWGSMQCPYYIHTALAALFNLPVDRIRVVQMETGGGFGGKEEYPSVIAGHAALLAWKSGRPVKMIYDRAEDMAATTKRHPSRTRHRTAIGPDGRLLAMEIDFTIDGGAYCTLSPVVLSRGTIHAAGPYACPNVRVSGRAVATNAPPHGAFRGFGAPQSLFALERHMDKVAAAAGLAPDEFRRRNFIRTGDTLAVGQTIREPVTMGALLDRALALSDYHQKRQRFERENARRSVRKGIGLAAFMHGAGFTGSGEVHLSSVVAAEATVEGTVRILSASTEIGQGTNTIFSQIAAEALGIDAADIEIAQPDTAIVPNSGPTVASRTCMVVGKLVEMAALAVKHALIDAGYLPAFYSRTEFRSACARYIEAFGTLRGASQYAPPPGLKWDDEKYLGDAYGTYGWAVYVAEVSVDTRTWETRVDDFVAVQEVGKVINPTLAMGQIEGGVAQGIGWALYEDVVWREGRMINAQMTNYIMPTSMDLPPIRVYFEEVPYAYGPGGAKGIGELPMDGPAPAIFNAVAQAIGADVTRLPLTPERLMSVMEESAVG